jgi:hypothetical protein
MPRTFNRSIQVFLHLFVLIVVLSISECSCYFLVLRLMHVGVGDAARILPVDNLDLLKVSHLSEGALDFIPEYVICELPETFLSCTHKLMSIHVFTQLDLLSALVRYVLKGILDVVKDHDDVCVNLFVNLFAY